MVVNSIVTAVAGKLVPGPYDGYASCPLTTAIGKTVLAEFVYGGKVTPTLPLTPGFFCAPVMVGTIARSRRFPDKRCHRIS